MGSPPRVREERACRAPHLLTPQDHPRVCGKNFPSDILSAVTSGSPPRVREEHNRRPARCYLSRDHPRVCGKNIYGI